MTAQLGQIDISWYRLVIAEALAKHFGEPTEMMRWDDAAEDVIAALKKACLL